MKRRLFLKALAVSPIAPSVLMAKEKILGQPKVAGVLRDGLENSFVYGGKLFRVYPDYFDKGFTRLRLLEYRHEINYIIRDEEYANTQYRNCICEYMLAKLDN